MLEAPEIELEAVCVCCNSTCDVCGGQEAYYWRRVHHILVKVCASCKQNTQLTITHKGAFASEIGDVIYAS